MASWLNRECSLGRHEQEVIQNSRVCVSWDRLDVDRLKLDEGLKAEFLLKRHWSIATQVEK